MGMGMGMDPPELSGLKTKSDRAALEAAWRIQLE
jgi:hypothetical protein